MNFNINTGKFFNGQPSIFFALVIIFSTVINSQAQIPYKSGLSIGTGIYAMEGIGVNPYAGVRYNHYLSQGKHFVEATLGISSIESEVLKSIGNFNLYDGSRLWAFEMVYGYDAKMWGTFPFLTAGVANVNLGGQNKYAGVLGFGKRLRFESLFGSEKISLRYDFRDHIFRQKLSLRDAFITHNFILTLNLELFL